MSASKQRKQRMLVVDELADRVAAYFLGHNKGRLGSKSERYKEVYPEIIKRYAKGQYSIPPTKVLTGVVNETIREFFDTNGPQCDTFYPGHPLEDMDPQDDSMSHVCRAFGLEGRANVYNDVRTQMQEVVMSKLREALMELFTGKGTKGE